MFFLFFKQKIDLVALWEIEKIGNLIQSTRQHTALYRFNENNFQFPLKNFILNPKNFKCSAVENWQLNLSNSYLKNLNSVLNPSQVFRREKKSKGEEKEKKSRRKKRKRTTEKGKKKKREKEMEKNEKNVFFLYERNEGSLRF